MYIISETAYSGKLAHKHDNRMESLTFTLMKHKL